MIKRFLPVFCPSLILAAMILAGCQSPPQETAALTPEEKSALTRRAKPPQTFGITAQTAGDGAVFSGIFRQHQNHIGNLKFQERDDAFVPVVKINDGKALLLVDTAAAESWLTVDAFRELNGTPLIGPDLFERMPRHVYDPFGGFASVVPKVTMENLHVENGLFHVRNARGTLDALARGEDKSLLDGVLGADALRSFEFVRISLKSGKMIVSGSSVYPYAANAFASLPLINLRGGLGIEAMIDGEKINVLIDLAGRFEMAKADPVSPLIRQVTLGDVVFRQVEVIRATDAGLGEDSPPRIGRKLLERYDLVINQRGRQLLLERPTE